MPRNRVVFRPILLFDGDRTSVKLPALLSSERRIRRKIMDQANLIVPEKLLRLVRSTAVRRAVVAAILPFIGVVAAFGIAPDTVTEKVTVQNVIEQIALPVAPVADTSDEAYTREERIQRGDTIA